ncbi:MAG TPA: PRC-barrel domain-containing protein [Candidatus Acidoferrum sp.]|nr:PRC-barrel domain-containing protein [Candidatus Acidoferrum sp.]
MVKYIIAKQLVGKRVVTTDGYDLGRFVDAEISEITGKINAMLVEPSLDGGLAGKVKVEGGAVRVPYTSVRAVNDFIMVDRKDL